MLEPKNITLRSLTLDDCYDLYNWSQDKSVTQLSISTFAPPKSKTDIANWITIVNDSNAIVAFGICYLDKLIGYAGITSMNNLNSTGEYFILIGNKDYWGKGIGTEVTKLVTEHGINSLYLNRIELNAAVSNKGALRVYEKAGYKHEGVMRQAAFYDGQFMDKVLMSVLACEWGV